ncbi:hypothetical protein WJX72_002423 [[Myrmecia] bisecta]|uniref:Uncharacterized protein n=1 Tax=[Myrmecia] bisecta TaxID=41462 RepID=A0AAW1QEF5_9CHLO
MAHIAFKVGARVQSADQAEQRGTVRYVGPVQGHSPAVYVGVEWDDAARGTGYGLQGTPLMQSLPGGLLGFQLLVAHLPGLTVVNGSEVARIRETAERMTIRHYHDADPKPERVQELISIHGIVLPFAKVSLECPTSANVGVRYFDSAPIQTTIKLTWTVRQLRAFLAKESGVRASKLRLFYLDTGLNFGAEEMRVDSVQLSRYNIRDGDEVLVDTVDPGHRVLTNPLAPSSRTIQHLPCLDTLIMQRSACWLLSLLCATIVLPNLCTAVTTLSDWIPGTSTLYGGAPDGVDPYSPSFGTKEGSCGYGMLDKSQFPYWSVAALPPNNRFFTAGPLNGCGQCFQIQCVNDGGQYAGRCNSDPNQRSVSVMISDTCRSCDTPDHLDMQALTFNKVAPMKSAKINMQYRRVECTPPADMKVNVMDSRGGKGWMRLVVEEAAGRASISNVFLKGPTSDWVAMTNRWGASWEISSAPGFPLDMRIVCDDGEEVTAVGALQSATKLGQTALGVQFTLNGGSGGSSGSPQDLQVFAGPPQGAAAPPSTAPPACSDVPPDSNWTCSQQKSFGSCSQGFMKDYCLKSCGVCQ